MIKTNIPYDLIHQLEAKFGSLSQVPEDNPMLARIRKILELDRRSPILKVHLREEIKELLDKGYLLKM